MASLIKKFSASYDFVIIDTPSLSTAVDAPILGKMADGILLVVQPGIVDSGSAASAKEFLEQSGQNVLGQVVNGVTSENQLHSYYAKEYYVEESTTDKITKTTTASRSWQCIFVSSKCGITWLRFFLVTTRYKIVSETNRQGAKSAKEEKKEREEKRIL